jgi:hypothetical protein
MTPGRIPPSRQHFPFTQLQLMWSRCAATGALRLTLGSAEHYLYRCTVLVKWMPSDA